MVRMNYFYKKLYHSRIITSTFFTKSNNIFLFFDILHKCHLSYICLTCKGSYHLKVMPAFTLFFFANTVFSCIINIK